MDDKKRLSFVHLYKFIAAILIALFLHYNDHFIPSLGDDIKNNFLDNDFLGMLCTCSFCLVEFFFIFSGMLFMKVFVPRITSNEYDLKKFLKNRIIRIMPYLFVTTCIMFLLEIISVELTEDVWSGVGSIDVTELILNIVLFGNGAANRVSLNGPVWYLSVLMICYILGYFLAKIYYKYKNELVFLIPIFVGLVVYLNSGAFRGLLNYNVSRGLVSFFIGILLYYYMKKYDNINKKYKTYIKIILSAIVISIFIILAFGAYEDYLGNMIIIGNFLLFPSIIYISYNSKILNKICDNKFIKFLGDLSFDIYILNFIILCSTFLIIKKLDINDDILNKKWLLIWFIIVLEHLVICVVANFIRKKIRSSIKKEIEKKKKENISINTNCNEKTIEEEQQKV